VEKDSGIFGIDHLWRDSDPKNHNLWGDEFFGGDAPRVWYELKPVRNRDGEEVKNAFVAWIILDNPKEGNSYTTKMVKGVIAAMNKASNDSRVVMVVFTAKGSDFFCTGGNTREYAQYYAQRPNEYGKYMDLFIAMVDSILRCNKPVINLINGMRVAGGQEIGMACDLSFAVDTAILGQAGPIHGSAPDGGSTDFLPLFLTIEDAMNSCISCDMWTAYDMYRRRLITEVVPVLVDDAGKFVRNPMVIHDHYVDDGEIVFGKVKNGDEFKAAKELTESLSSDLTKLHKLANIWAWKFLNEFPGCLMKSVDGIRNHKRRSWDTYKVNNRHWLATNQLGEGALGFSAYNARKITGKKVINFVLFHQMLAEGHPFNDVLAQAVMPKPKSPEK